MKKAAKRPRLVPKPSSTTIKSSIGSTKYKRGKHPVKQAVNNWLLHISLQELSNPTTKPRFALLLETGACQTIDTLLTKSIELGITAQTIIVPNPNLDECTKLNAIHPEILAIPTTSHEFLRLLTTPPSSEEQESPLKTELSRRGWTGTFDLVWLDYCGTFNSRPGRKRQQDIRLLFRYDMIPSPGILVVTASQRGAVTYYTDEVVDIVLGFIKHIGSGKGTGDGGKRIDNDNAKLGKGKERDTMAPRKVACAGVAVHNITSRMYTVAVVVDRVTQQVDDCIKAKGVILETSLSPATSTSTSIATSTTTTTASSSSTASFRTNETSITTYVNWHPLQNLDESTGTSLWHGLRRIATLFMSYVDTQGTALIMDSKLLPITTALLDHGITHVHAIIPVPLDAAVAQEILLRRNTSSISSTNSTTSISSNSSRATIIMEPISKAISIHNSSNLSQLNSSCTTIWMSYDKTMSATDLQHCDQWSDINNLMNKGWIRPHTIIGIHLKYSEIGTLWDYSHVDWLVNGIRRVVNKNVNAKMNTNVTTFENEKTTKKIDKKSIVLDIKILSVCNFTVRAPNVVVMLQVIDLNDLNDLNDLKESSSNESKNAKPFLNGFAATSQSLPNNKWMNRLPLKWLEHHGDWKLVPRQARFSTTITQRDTPSASSEKYKLHVQPWIIRLMACLNLNHVLYHEPGFNHILPSLIEWTNEKIATRNMYCCAANDYVQFMDLQTRGNLNTSNLNSSSSSVPSTTSIVLEPIKVPVQSVDVAILLCDGGVRTWKETWLEWCVQWMKEMDTKSLYCLVLHVNAPKGKNHVDDLLKELVNGKEDDTFLILPQIYRNWQQSSFVVVAVLFGRYENNGTEIDACTKLWEELEVAGSRKTKKKRKHKQSKVIQ